MTIIPVIQEMSHRWMCPKNNWVVTTWEMYDQFLKVHHPMVMLVFSLELRGGGLLARGAKRAVSLVD